MNLCILIVRIVSKPTQDLLRRNISVTRMQVELVEPNQKQEFDKFTALLWGNLGEKVIEHFRVGDYVIIEGVLKLQSFYSNIPFQKKLNFTIFNICPFLLVDLD